MTTICIEGDLLEMLHKRDRKFTMISLSGNFYSRELCHFINAVYNLQFIIATFIVFIYVSSLALMNNDSYTCPQ